MTWNRIPWACLLASAFTVIGCTSSPSGSTPDASTPDASTDYEWDGGYVPLEETGNSWPDTGPFASCTFTANTREPCTNDFSIFDLSACNRESLANANTDGLFMLTTRSTRGTFSSNPIRLRSDGGTQYINDIPITQQASDGNARLYAAESTWVDGTKRRMMLALCEAPQAPDFTGCYATCLNGKVSTLSTFKSQRATTWRAGEAEASGLELVSENFVDLGMPVDVYVTKGHAYVVSVSNTRIGITTGGLTVFDVSNKSAPVKVKTIQLETDNFWNGVWAKGDTLYVASAARGVLVFDISNPADPQLVRDVPGGNASVHTVFVDGNRLYASASEAVILFDITNPTQPLELNRYSPDGASPHDMFAIGDRLYVSSYDQAFLVADVSNPNDIRTLGQYTYPTMFSHHNAVGTFGGRTIAFEGGEGPGEHLRVLDITDPAHIVKIGEFQLRPEISIHNMVLVGKKLYIAWYQEGVRVLDVSNPTKPTQVAHYNTFRESETDTGHYFAGAYGIRVPGDGFIYAVDSWRGLLILREQ